MIVELFYEKICINNHVYFLYINLFGLNIYLYNDFSDDNSINFITLENDKNINSYQDIVKYFETKYKSQKLNIEISEIKIFDNTEELIILNINIILKIEEWEIFNGSHHTSPILEEIFVNLLQPEVSREEYNIFGIFVRLNGVFLDKIYYHLIYDTIITKNMYFDLFNKIDQ